MEILLAVNIVLLLILHSIWPLCVYVSPKLEVIEPSELNTGDIILTRPCVACTYTDDILNNISLFSYRYIFNTFRWYCIGTHSHQYTHTAVVIKVDNKPYIAHIDRAFMMYDEFDKKKYKQRIVMSSLDHLNLRGGKFHVYKFKGDSKPMKSWIDSQKKKVSYPKYLIDLLCVNALQVQTHPENTMACTDFVEYALQHMGLDIIPSNQATIADIYKLVQTHKQYEHVPMILHSKCCDENHM